MKPTVTSFLLLHETASDFVFEVVVEGQTIGFTRTPKLSGIQVANLVPDLEYTIMGIELGKNLEDLTVEEKP